MWEMFTGVAYRYLAPGFVAGSHIPQEWSLFDRYHNENNDQIWGYL